MYGTINNTPLPPAKTQSSDLTKREKERAIERDRTTELQWIVKPPAVMVAKEKPCRLQRRRAEKGRQTSQEKKY